MNQKNDLEGLALRDPNALIKKMGGGVMSGYGNGVSPVPPGVPIIDNRYTRDAARPVDQIENEGKE